MTGHHQINGVGVEALTLTQLHAQLLHQIASVVLHLAAGPAHEMKVVVGVRRFPARGVVHSQMRLAGEVQLGEQRERAVDRREIDVRIDLMDPRGHLLGGQVLVG